MRAYTPKNTHKDKHCPRRAPTYLGLVLVVGGAVLVVVPAPAAAVGPALLLLLLLESTWGVEQRVVATNGVLL